MGAKHLKSLQTPGIGNASFLCYASMKYNTVLTMIIKKLSKLSCNFI